jgi:hypothetical protein|tara:strand:- start:12035 stop:12166 length:132 start_codon:yes stop_codon:yes gene_type:complete
MERKLLIETVELLNELGTFKVLNVEKAQVLSSKIENFLEDGES